MRADPSPLQTKWRKGAKNAEEYKMYRDMLGVGNSGLRQLQEICSREQLLETISQRHPPMVLLPTRLLNFAGKNQHALLPVYVT
jgi:hypothetical protein